MSACRTVILQDRYSGAYSGGSWLAVAAATDMFDNEQSRVEFCLSAIDGPSGSDVEAASFWVNPPPWVAVGQTPDDALSKLRDLLS